MTSAKSQGGLLPRHPPGLRLLFLGMNPLVVQPHADMRHRGASYPVKEIRAYSGALAGQPWRPANRALAQVSATPGEPTELQRYAHVGILAVGLFTAFLAWPHRKKFGGSVGLSAGAGALGVGLAFWTLDLIGFRPGSGGECL